MILLLRLLSSSSPSSPPQKRTLLSTSSSFLCNYYLSTNNNNNNNNNNIGRNIRIKSQTTKTTTTTTRKRMMMMTNTTMPSSVSSASSSSLSLLPNSLKVDVINDDGHVEFTVVEEEEEQEEDYDEEEQQEQTSKKKKAKIGEDNNNITNNTTTPTPTPTPTIYYPNEDDYVIQYHRQLRKFHANEKSLQQLTIEQHLHVIYEDENKIVVNKPSGILCVPGLHNKPNLLNLVCDYCNLSTTTSTNISQYIVHRLDMDTSGIVVFAKKLEIQKQLHAVFRERDLVNKQYTALLCGHLPYNHGHIRLPIQKDHKYPPFMRIATPRSKREVIFAVQDIQKSSQYKKLIRKNPKQCHTEFTVIKREYLKFDNNKSNNDDDDDDDDDDGGGGGRNNNKNNCDNSNNESTSSTSTSVTTEIPVTRISLIPHTGRTHQLRVHCAAIGYPIVGDPAYGLYGEANPNGGLDYLNLNLNLYCNLNCENEKDYNDDNKSQSQLSQLQLLDIQKQITKLRPPHEKNNTMCLHSTKLTFNKRKKQPNTISSSGNNKTIIEEEWIVPSPF